MSTDVPIKYGHGKNPNSRNGFKKGHKVPSAMKGKHHSAETKAKISLKKLGRKAPWVKGYQKGEKHFRWIADRTQLKRFSKQGERRTSAYFYWRKQVWERDNYKCKIANNDCDGRIEAHHILSWRDHAELRYQINNGITLCHFHHPRKRVDEERLSPYFQGLVTAKMQQFVN